MDKITTPQIISKTPKYKLGEFVTVYNYEHLTTQEIISAIIEKINEIIDNLNALNIEAILQQIQDLINNFINSLDAKVKEIIIQMFRDGELDVYIEPIINRLLDVAIDNKLNLFLTEERFRLKVVEIVNSLDLGGDIDVDSIINTFKDLIFKKTKVAINPFYTTINIAENNTYYTNNLVFFNVVIKRGDNRIFNKNTLYKIGRLAYETENNINILYATAKSTLTGEYTTTASAIIYNNGDIVISPTTNATEILIGGTAPLLYPLNGALTPTETPIQTELEEFIEKSRTKIREDLITNWNYTEQLEVGSCILSNSFKNIVVTFNNATPINADQIEITNQWTDYRGVDEIQRVLRYMFAPEDAQFIIDNWTSRQSENVIRIVVGEKTVEWRNQNSIVVKYYIETYATLEEPIK